MWAISVGTEIDPARDRLRVRRRIDQFMRRGIAGPDGHGTLRRAIYAGQWAVDHTKPEADFDGDEVLENFVLPNAPPPPGLLFKIVPHHGHMAMQAMCAFTQHDYIAVVGGMLTRAGILPPATHNASITFEPPVGWQGMRGKFYAIHIGDEAYANYFRFLSFTQDPALANVGVKWVCGGMVPMVVATRAINPQEILLVLG